ncbi:uncharacterized protein LOC115232677 [Argonauta hians]
MFLICLSVVIFLTNSTQAEVTEKSSRNSVDREFLNYTKSTGYDSLRLVEITFAAYCNRLDNETKPYITLCSEQWQNNTETILEEFNFMRNVSDFTDDISANSLKKLAYDLERFLNLFEVLLAAMKEPLCEHAPNPGSCKLCDTFKKRLSSDYCNLKVTTQKLRDLEAVLLMLSEKYVKKDLEELHSYIKDASLQQHEDFVTRMLKNTSAQLNQLQNLVLDNSV